MRKADGLLKLVGLCMLAGVLLAGVMFPVVGGLGVASNQASATVDNTSSELANIPPPLVTTITDRKGKAIATLYNQFRIPTASDQISDAMKWAIISIEDRRFYEHNGVDWKGTMRAAISNTSGADTQGASTLTQQYVKNYLINVVYDGDTTADKIGRKKAQEQSIARKLKEARIAIQLETKMDKDQILTGYLNVVEFSRRIFGVGAAARADFGVKAEDLTVTQAALLAGMVNNPGMLDPWNHPERAKDRRNLVIDQMVLNRKLDASDAERLKKEPLGVLPDGPNKPAANCVGAGPEHGFFCQYVEDYLIEAGMDKDDLYRNGYTIKTTLDRKANEHAKDSAEKQVPKTAEHVANTLSLVKPGEKRHEVVALVANKDYGTDSNKDGTQTTYALPSGIYNTQGAGSVYKTFTAAAALDEGVLGIYDTMSTPSFYESNVFLGGPERCTPISGTYKYCLGNSEGSNYPSRMTLQKALASSPNTGFVILEEKAGMDAVVEMASKLGMRKTMASNGSGRTPDPEADEVLHRQSQLDLYGQKDNWAGTGAFTLGFSPLSGLELANVGATIMSGGVWCPPTPIVEVRDRHGEKVKIKEKSCEQAVPEGLANTLAVGMSKDDTEGTARAAASQVGWDRPVIGKTGTTQLNRSATFLGATPQLAGAGMVFVWGGDTNQGLCDGGVGNVYTCGNGNMFGGKTPARTWFGAMTEILEGEPKLPLPNADPKYERR